MIPASINTVHLIFTIMAFFIFASAGWQLMKIALTYPFTNRLVNGGALLICFLIVLIAWLVP